MTKERNLLQELDEAIADLRARRDDAVARQRSLEQQARTAHAEFDRACVAGGDKARQEAEENLIDLDRKRTLAEREVSTIERSMRTGEGSAVRTVALAIRQEREAELKTLAESMRVKGAEIEQAARQYLDLVAELARLYQTTNSDLSAAWDAAQVYVPESQRTITSPMPMIDHAGHKGSPYLINPTMIELTFRNAYNAPMKG